MSSSFEKEISSLNKVFLEEAANSPHLFRDMASMEKYMAESYGERVIIELLQNADDAYAKNFKIKEEKGHVYVGNDGKDFDKNDIQSICRSGTSLKKRGETIGYRGVGFKSTTHLANEILIHSNNTYFTFSKSKTSRTLSIKEEEVPTIRIPFLIKETELDNDIQECVKAFKKNGYSTVFIFPNANLDTLKQEIDAISGDYFLFLNNIINLIIEFDDSISEGNFERTKDTITIRYKKEYQSWKIISESGLQLAFALNEEKKIIPCAKEQALFHCYLPTYETSPYPFKINGDFSTDPSRKHILLDDKTKLLLIQSASLLANKVIEGIKENNMDVKEMLPLMAKKTSFSKASDFTIKQINEQLWSEWIPMQDGSIISPEKYVRKPSFLNEVDWQWIRTHTNLKSTVPNLSVDFLATLDTYFQPTAKLDYSIQEWVTMVSNREFIKEIPDFILKKIYTYLIKKIRTKSLINNEVYNLSSCLIKFDQEIVLWEE